MCENINHTNSIQLVEPLEGGPIRFVFQSTIKKKKKKYKEFLLFNFIYFFLDYFSRSVLFLRSLETDCRWHKFVCVYTENSFYDSKNQTRLLLIRTHLINFSIFYNLLSISIRRHSIREYVFGFWFFGFFHNR